MSQRARRGKRRKPVEYPEEEETVDDMAYAASFAMVTGPPPTDHTHDDPHTKDITSETKNDEDDSNGGDNGENEDIDIDDDVDSDDDSEDETKDPADDETDKTEPDNEDEQEDHEELAKAIAAMEDDDVIEEQHEDVTKTSHKTQHEVDAYHTPIQELEQHLQFRLTVEDSSNENKSRKLQASDLKCAGTVKHHMVDDRTVVIESNPPVRGQSLNPLGEGTLLLLKSGENGSSINQNLIPLGRILETFGPVSRPLYTIRLPEPRVADTKSSFAVVEKEEEETSSPDAQSNGNKEQSTKGDDTGGNNEKSEKDVGTPKEESKSTNGTAPPPVDNWGPNGKYSQVLQTAQESSVAVYFVEDEAMLIDTDLILRNSGKGCDASNLYDEEVLNKDEMYYSDDEKERQAKSRRKGRGSRNQRQQQQPSNTFRPVPSGFHISTTPTGFHAAPSVPAGFHPPPVAPAPYQHYSNQRYPNAPPPPPPPPPPSAAPYPYYPNHGYPGPNAPPPPPTNRNGPPPPPNQSHTPPAYHY